ncbi:hypothetical protein [Sandarakinorhabdus sp. AAP62]|uniref:hypothetical protein n=1 Tax=Sandarakinorhabdus sp. AAP62 TaxID=1248916 RepID=UPI001266F83C|nr:hypothetical protein [Sandarakinorhabdus sp. AAP62]
MPVKISATASQSSNKPQPFPKPKPPYELFPTTLSMCDGRIVRVSVPVPDRLSMIIDITPDIFGPKTPAGVTVAQWVKGAGHYLNSNPHNTQPLGCQYFENKQWYRHVTLGMGPRDSSVRFEFSEQTNKAPARLRIELNPRKLGPKGFKTLLAILNDPDGPFAGKAVLKSARVTRIDLAVDLEGVQTDDLVAFHKNEQQRSIYIGSDGVIETLYLHGKSSKTKPAGKVLVGLYDRAKERIKKGKEPPFGPSPTTRVELVKTMKAPHNSLAKIATMADPFGSIRVGYLMGQGAKPKQWWREYVGLRRGKNHVATIALLGLDATMAEQFASAYLVPCPELVSKGINWSGWDQGLEVTGLNLLLGAQK